MIPQQDPPWGLPVQAEGIPEPLRKLKRWVVWRADVENGKHQKRPKQVDHPARGASVADPTHWRSFDQAHAALRKSGLLSGVGFVLTDVRDVAPLFAVDIDHCLVDGDLTPDAKAIVAQLPIYWEWSPSGAGLRGIGLCEAQITTFLDRARHVELYAGDSPRYITLTGHEAAFSAGMGFVAGEVLHRVLPAPKETESATKSTAPELAPLSAEDRQALEALLPERLREFLRDGELHEYASRSEALFATLCCLVANDIDAVTTFSYAAQHDGLFDIALEHRQRKPPKALQYLWDETQRALAVAGPVSPEAFDALPEEPPSEKSLSNRFSLAELASYPVPPRRWLVQDWVPMAAVTLLYGDGGTGKSLLAQDLMSCTATGIPWLNQEVCTTGPVLAFLCEDDRDEYARRQHSLMGKYALTHNLDYSALGDVHFWCRSGQDNLLMTFDGRDRGKITEAYKHLNQWCREVRPKLVVLDTAADVFGGNEIVRAQVRQFINALTHLAHTHDCAVVLCAHPSQSGQASGAGTGGSTAWSNTARSRMYLTRSKDNVDGRVLELMKSNYAGVGKQIHVHWHQGAFVPDVEIEPDPDRMRMACRVAEEHIAALSGTGRDLNMSPKSPTRFAPAYLEKVAEEQELDFEGDALTRADFDLAIDLLLRTGRVRERETKDSRGRIVRTLTAD